MVPFCLLVIFFLSFHVSLPDHIQCLCSRGGDGSYRDLGRDWVGLSSFPQSVIFPKKDGLGDMRLISSTVCSCPKTLWESKNKGNRLIHLVEEISRQPNMQAVVWLLLEAFSQASLGKMPI